MSSSAQPDHTGLHAHLGSGQRWVLWHHNPPRSLHASTNSAERALGNPAGYCRSHSLNKKSRQTTSQHWQPQPNGWSKTDLMLVLWQPLPDLSSIFLVNFSVSVLPLCLSSTSPLLSPSIWGPGWRITGDLSVMLPPKVQYPSVRVISGGWIRFWMIKVSILPLNLLPLKSQNSWASPLPGYLSRLAVPLRLPHAISMKEFQKGTLNLIPMETT